LKEFGFEFNESQHISSAEVNGKTKDDWNQNDIVQPLFASVLDQIFLKWCLFAICHHGM